MAVSGLPVQAVLANALLTEAQTERDFDFLGKEESFCCSLRTPGGKIQLRGGRLEEIKGEQTVLSRPSS